MRFFFLLLTFWIGIQPLLAQSPLGDGVVPALQDTVRDEELRRLLQQRQRLMQQYDEQNRRNRALLGGKSKRDQRDIIETLKEIIRKDNEIVRRIRTLNYQEIKQVEASSVGETRSKIFREYQLTQEVEGLENRLKKVNGELAQSQETHQRQQARIRSLQRTVAVLAALLGLAGGGLFWLYRRLRPFS